MRVLPTLLVVAVMAAAGCRRDDAAAPAQNPPPASTSPGDATGAGTIASDTHTSADTAPPSPAPAAPPSPGVSLALVTAVDEHEIAAVEQTQGRKFSPPVREYAQMLHREHSENLAAARALSSAGHLIQPETTTEVHALVGKGKATLEALAGTPHAQYERAWLQAMVDGHAEALSMLDSRLIPAAQDEPLRNFLNNTRDHMAMHLERGRALLEASQPR
ncbi:DUF4142 domain-containing protein [Lysobacter auxotrophicus]|uniref:DUF4142 domain-containing protein n=1 Tax=Lysobacter auxotrophicus TaxID=2992573 RepID=A0ABM8DE62_9GAMM|nr:DUF4142 domain-containing protein [Lysobacter auxotrophicus]BDU16883.1 DUF4142 domain-containing protein [Lysobacter auxotrophicus]